MPEFIRQVIREPRFEEELRRLIAKAIAADQFVEAAEFLIARDPLIANRRPARLGHGNGIARRCASRALLHFR